ncbi:MAG TPA: hypothetical protein VF161_10415 [Steroidobacteraceae bacterium]
MLYRLIPLMAALVAVSAMAGDEDKSSRAADATFKSMDRNADERLSQSEVASDQQLSQSFASLDTDSDGYLSKREYAAHSKERRGMEEPGMQDRTQREPPYSTEPRN